MKLLGVSTTWLQMVGGNTAPVRRPWLQAGAPEQHQASHTAPGEKVTCRQTAWSCSSGAPTAMWVHLCRFEALFWQLDLITDRNPEMCLLPSSHKAEGWQSSALSDIQEHTLMEKAFALPNQHISSSPLLSVWVVEIFRLECSSAPSGKGLQTNKQFYFICFYLQRKETLACSLWDAFSLKLWNISRSLPTHTLNNTKTCS